MPRPLGAFDAPAVAEGLGEPVDEDVPVIAGAVAPRVQGDLAAAGLELVEWLTDDEDLFALSLARPAP